MAPVRATSVAAMATVSLSPALAQGTASTGVEVTVGDARMSGQDRGHVPGHRGIQHHDTARRPIGAPGLGNGGLDAVLTKT